MSDEVTFPESLPCPACMQDSMMMDTGEDLKMVCDHCLFEVLDIPYNAEFLIRWREYQDQRKSEKKLVKKKDD